MNYIHQLQQQVKELEQMRSEADQLVTEFRVYLESNKFWEDTTIEVADVQRRLMPLRHLLLDGGNTMNKDQRIERAEVRQGERSKRSPEQQLQLLDKRLGKGVGASKERAKLLAQIGSK